MKSIPISFAVILLALAVLPVACGSPETPEAAPAPAETDSAAAEISVETTEEETPPVSDPITELSATMKTNKGDIHLTLFADKTPITVANFVNLVQRGYFDGLTFHRVIPDFMVQGGCPLGTGTGGPGYRFEDEIHPDLKHDRPGILSMANSGPGTNGSQFFITHVPTPWLDGKHSIFGAIVGPEDQDVINAIAGGDTISTITIDGDTGPLLAAQQSHLDEWNAVLDK